MKPNLIDFHLFCVALASFCYVSKAQNGYQYPRPTNKQSNEKSEGQSDFSNQPTDGLSKPNQNQSPGQVALNGYQYSQPGVSFTTGSPSPQPQTMGFQSSESSYPSYVDSSTATNSFQNENTFPTAVGGYTPSGSANSFSGYMLQPAKNSGRNGGSTSATFSTFPGSSSIGTTTSPGRYEGGTGPGAIGSELQISSNSLGPSSAPSTTLNSGGAGTLGPSSAFAGNSGSRGAGTLGPSSAFAGNSGPLDQSFSNSNSPSENDSSNGDFSAIPGTPDVDYPILDQIPKTAFSCATQKYPGYYADVEARCQVFHICANGLKYSFLCPKGTIFSQMHFVCVWWNQFDCNLSESLYYLNENLYKSQPPSTNFGSNSGSSQALSSNFGPSIGPQGPSANFGPSVGPQGPSANFGFSAGPQGPTANFGPSTGPQGPSANFGASTGPQGPTANFGPSVGPQGPSANFGPSAAPQGPFVNYGPPVGPQEPSANFGSSAGPQGPSANFGPSGGPQGPSANFGPSGRPHGPSANYGPPVGPQGSSTNNFGPSAGSQGAPTDVGTFVGPQRPPGNFPQAPSTNYGSPLEGTSSQITSANFGSFPNTQSSPNERPPAVYGPPNDGTQGQSFNSRPQKPSSYVKPSNRSPNNQQQTKYMSNEPNQVPSSSVSFPGFSPPEYSTFPQVTTTQPVPYQTRANPSSDQFQNYAPPIDSTDSPLLSNQATKPSREYLPPFRRRR